MGIYLPMGYGLASIPFNVAGDSEEMVVTCGFDPDSALSYDEMAQEIQDQLFGQGIFNASSFSDEWTIGPVRIVYHAFNGPQEGLASGSRTGSLTDSETVPNNTAVLVQKRTARGGRPGRGRFYWPPFYPNEESITRTGVLAGAAVTGWQTAMTNWLSGCSSNGVPLFLLHSRLENGDPPAIEPDEITSLVVQTVVATQRTRLRR